MAHHASAKKRIRQSAKLRVHNRYYAKTMRNLIRDLRSATSKKEGEALLAKTISLIDRNAKRHIIHKNKAGNLKSELMLYVNKLS